MAKVIAVTNQKGGVGKTTTTINLGSTLSAFGKKVLIIDIDSQGNATQGLGVDKLMLEKKKITTYDLFLDDKKEYDKYIYKTSFDNLYIIGSSQNLVGLDLDYIGDMQKEKILKSIIKKIKKDYDYILIDCPPSLNTMTLNGMTAADSVLIPVQSEFYALEGMTQLLNSVQLCKKHLNPKLKIEGILITMYSSNTNLSESVRQEVKKYFGKYVYKTVIRRNIAIAEAPSYGIPINYYDKNAYGTFDYKKLAREVIENE